MELSGILSIDKTAGYTSHRVVSLVRRVAGQRSVGHTGTLDPGASGLLMLCLGNATLLSRFFTRLDKVYEGEILLGKRSTTYDREGEVTTVVENPRVTPEIIIETLNSLVGEQWQTPPKWSAIHVKGKRLYEYARRNDEVEIPRRKVTIHAIDLLAYTPPIVTFRARVSSGTYIRSLAHDVGERLGTGGLLNSLRRCSVGSFNVDNALFLEPDMLTRETITKNMSGIYEACNFLPRVVVDEKAFMRLRHGNPVVIKHAVPAERQDDTPLNETLVFRADRTFVAIALLNRDKEGYQILTPHRVVPMANKNP